MMAAMTCLECGELKAEYERLMGEHIKIVEQYQAAMALRDSAKMWELRFALSNSRMLGIRARDRLYRHQVAHERNHSAGA